MIRRFPSIVLRARRELAHACAAQGMHGEDCSGYWYGVFAPKGTPPGVIKQMTKELRAAMQLASIKEARERNGSDVPDLTGPAFAKMVSAGSFAHPSSKRTRLQSWLLLSF